MMANLQKQLKLHAFFILLIISIILGAVTGMALGSETVIFKPIADIFLQLLLFFLTPLVFFSVSSSVARMNRAGSLVKMMLAMLVAFVFTGIVAALYMIVIVIIFPPAQGFTLPASWTSVTPVTTITTQLQSFFSLECLRSLFSYHNMLSLVFVSVLFGFLVSLFGKSGKKVANFLEFSANIFMKTITFVMYVAPVGFFAFFAVLVGEFGPTLMNSYLHVTLIYYLAATFYFFAFFTFYAYLAGKSKGVKLFWQNIFLPAATSLATCSSAASIPANLQAAKRMNIAPEIYETVIPIGAILHKDGSVLGGIIKIAFLFGVFQMHFGGIDVLTMALMTGLLVGMVMGAIPSGGMLGELLIISVYGFPPQALMLIAAISILIDPIATMLNVTGDCVCSMLVSRIIEPSPRVVNKVG